MIASNFKYELLIQLLVNASLGVIGESLFIGMMPAPCERGLMIRPPYGGTMIKHDLPGYYKTEFSLIARSPDYGDGETLIQQAVSALTLANQTIGGVQFNYVRPITKPAPFPLSNGSEVEFQVRMQLCFADLAESSSK